MSKVFSSRRGLTLIELLIVFSVIGLLLALLLPAPRRVGDSGRRERCRNNVRQLALALNLYYDQYKTFPPAYSVDAHGKALHSWRTLILPFLDEKKLYDSIDLTKPWNAPVNAVARYHLVSAYRCPSADLHRKTSYLAVISPTGIFQPGKSRSLSEITDGSDKTLLLVEVDPKYAVEWMSPNDATEEIILKRGENPERTHPHMGGAHAVLADGTVRFLSEDMSRKDLHALTTINGNEVVGDF